MFNIDYKSRVPIHKQLYNQIRWLILNSSLEEGAELPSVRELASSLTINPNTIQKAYMELRRDGYIFSVPGKGNYVERITDKNREQEIDKLLIEMGKIVSKAQMLSVSEDELISFVKKIYKENEND